jgi:hypothetical protein
MAEARGVGRLGARIGGRLVQARTEFTRSGTCGFVPHGRSKSSLNRACGWLARSVDRLSGPDDRPIDPLH